MWLSVFSVLKKQVSSRIKGLDQWHLRLIIATFIVFVSVPCSAGSVSLTWDTNSDADYYIVCWSLSSTDPENHIEACSDHITDTAYGPQEFQAGTYSFAVKAYNACGNSSDYSDWVSVTIPSGTVADDDTTDAPPGDGDMADATLDEEPEEETPAFVIATGSPGVKSTDGFVPQTDTAIVEDVNDSPTIEVLDSYFSHLYWLKSGWSDYNALNGEARIAMGDIDDDGEDEMVVGFGPVSDEASIPGGFFQVLDDDYSHLAWGRVEWSDYNDINGETFPTCGDINGDGKDDIVIGLGPHGHGYVEVFTFTHGALSHESWLSIQWPDYNDMDGTVRPVCADIDGDGVEEIIAGLGSEGGSAEIPGGRFEVFGRQSQAWAHLTWGTINWPEYTEINGETWPAPGDLDGDGAMELAVGLGYGGDGQMAVFEFQDNKAVFSDWANIEWSEYNDLSGETRPVCGDVDSDGKDDIIIGWNTLASDSENANYFKVLSFNLVSRRWENLMDSKSIGADIDSVPVKGAVTQDEKIMVGMVGTLAGGKVLPPSVIPGASPVIGSDAGSSGCFLDTASQR